MLKYFTALIGYYTMRFPGALLGFIVGLFIEQYQTAQKPESRQNRGSGGGRFGDFQRRPVSAQDFELHLLSLCSIIIKADGEASQRELDYVRQYFVSAYGKERANAIFRTFNEVVKKREISTQRISTFLGQRTRYEMRLQILHFLFGIAQADGRISSPELNKLNEIAGFFRVRMGDFESIKAMFVRSADQAYTILEIDRSATDAEVKKAYREMVKKYHPDKVITEDEAIKKGAEEKFKEVQKAYETIQAERGMS
jgi:DnaJ like chaperone protein